MAVRPYNGKRQRDFRRTLAEPRRAACRHNRVALTGGLLIPAVRSGRLIAAPTTGNGSGIPAAPPSNAVGRHAHMPPWPGRDDRSLLVAAVRSGRLIAAPTTGNGSGIPAAPPSNAVGRHAHMPPWPGRDDRGLLVAAVRSGRLIAAPTTGNDSGCARRGGYQPPEQAPDSRRTFENQKNAPGQSRCVVDSSRNCRKAVGRAQPPDRWA